MTEYEWEESKDGTLSLWAPSPAISLVMVVRFSETNLWSWTAWGHEEFLYKRGGFLTSKQAEAQAINKLKREGLIE